MNAPVVPTDWVELRVHGVSGTPPEEVLGSTFVAQIAGDDRGRVFAPVDATGTRRSGAEGQDLEAYHWGQHTSGTWRQGLWLVLIPFAFVNAAHFMLPRRPDTGVGVAFHVACAAMLRLVGLCLTATFAFVTGFIVIDLLAWQRFLQVASLNGPKGLLVPGALVLSAVAMLLILYWLPGRTRAPEDSSAELTLALGSEGVRSRLNESSFFAEDEHTPVLRALHLATAFLVLNLLVAHSFHAGSALDVVSRTVLGLAAAAVVLLGDPTTKEDGVAHTARGWLNWARLVIVALAAGLLMFTAAWTYGEGGGGDVERTESLTAFDDIALAIGTYTVLGLLLLFIACCGLAWSTGSGRDRSGFRPYARGTAAFWCASAGVSLGVGYAGGFAEAVARSVRVPDKTGDGEADPVDRSEILEQVAIAWGVTLALLVVVAFGVYAVLRVRRAAYEQRLPHMYSLPSAALGLPRSWHTRVAKAIALARVKNWVPAILIVFGVVAVALSGSAGWQLCGAPDKLVGSLWAAPGCTVEAARPPFGVATLGVDDDGALVGWLGDLGTWTLVGLAGVLLLLGRKAVQLRGTRRGVNVLWDVVSFWPQAAHPLVPAPYARLVVPEVVNRIRWHLRQDPDRSVVVAGHSQGSLIAFTCILRLEQQERDRVGLVTFGSQLQTSFSRGFPAYVNQGLVAAVLKDLDGRWVNLYRETDPLAGPVLSWDHRPDGAPASSTRLIHDNGAVSPTSGPDIIDADTGRRSCGNDWRLLDPVPVDEARQQRPLGPIRGHGDYYEDPDWGDAVTCVRPRGPFPQQAADAIPDP